MTEIEEVEEVPEWLFDFLSARSKEEMDRADELAKPFMDKAHRKWLVTSGGEPMMLVGVFFKSLTSVPEVWMLAFTQLEENRIEGARTAREGVQELVKRYSALRVGVDKDFLRGRRFAEFLGFQAVGLVGNRIMYEARHGV